MMAEIMKFDELHTADRKLSEINKSFHKIVPKKSEDKPNTSQGYSMKFDVRHASNQ